VTVTFCHYFEFVSTEIISSAKWNYECLKYDERLSRKISVIHFGILGPLEKLYGQIRVRYSRVTVVTRVCVLIFSKIIAQRMFKQRISNVFVHFINIVE